MLSWYDDFQRFFIFLRSFYTLSRFSADQAGQCSTIILDPHHVLVGYNRKTVDAKSYEDCLAQCLAAKDFKCNSGQYYSDV